MNQWVIFDFYEKYERAKELEDKKEFEDDITKHVRKRFTEDESQKPIATTVISIL